MGWESCRNNNTVDKRKEGFSDRRLGERRGNNRILDKRKGD